MQFGQSRCLPPAPMHVRQWVDQREGESSRLPAARLVQYQIEGAPLVQHPRQPQVSDQRGLQRLDGVVQRAVDSPYLIDLRQGLPA